MKYFITTFLLVTLFTLTTFSQQPGTPDKSYDNHNGAEIIKSQSLMQSSAMQKDDKLLTGGSNTNNNFVLTRYNKNSSVDSSFGTNGSVTTAFGSPDNNLYYGYGWLGIVIQPDGKIVTLGYGSGFNNDFFNTNILLARFLPDGTPDETFGEQGKVVSDLNYFDIANALALQPDGKILVTDYAYDDLDLNNIRSFVSRYNVDGSLDKSFGGGIGFVTYETNSPQAYAIIVQPDNKIIAGGGTDLNRDFFLIRYLPDGGIDETFGNGGTVLLISTMVLLVFTLLVSLLIKTATLLRQVIHRVCLKLVRWQ